MAGRSAEVVFDLDDDVQSNLKPEAISGNKAIRR